MKRALITLATLCLSATAFADNNSPVQFSGFGTLGTAISHDRDADFVSYFEQSEGVGATHGRDNGLDTLFGVQANATLTKGLTATAQIQSHRLADKTSTPYFEWANLKYDFSNGWNVRLGRVVTPMFMISDSRAVGYAQTAVRLPGEVYNLNPIRYVDGGDVSYEFAVNDVLYKAAFTGGKLTQKLPTFFGDLSNHYDVKLFTLAIEVDSSIFRFGYGHSILDFSNADLDLLGFALDTLSAANVPGASRFAELAVYDHFWTHFFDFGYQYDDGRFLIQSEIVGRRAKSYIVTNDDAFYLLAGYRIGHWTPYVRYSQTNSLNDRTDVPVINADYTNNDLYKLMADGINGFGAEMTTLDERNCWTLGTRLDIADNYALKMQVDTLTKPAANSAFFQNFTPDFLYSRQHFTLYSMTLDFVF